MPPGIREITVERLSILDNGMLELAGQAVLSGDYVDGDATAWLRLSKRNAKESHLKSGNLTTDSSGRSVFRFELDMRAEANAAGDDTLDAHLVLKTGDGDFMERLGWPQAFSSWVAYPTVYGNLSLKRMNVKVGGP
ncbi:hypothetical protein [Arthrobacter pigmenti]